MAVIGARRWIRPPKRFSGGRLLYSLLFPLLLHCGEMLPSKSLLSFIFLLNHVFPLVYSSFTYQFGVPGSCDDLEVSWTGLFAHSILNQFPTHSSEKVARALSNSFLFPYELSPTRFPMIFLTLPHRFLEHQGLIPSQIQQ